MARLCGVILFMFFMSVNVYAVVAKILDVKGDVRFAGKPVSGAQDLTESGKLETGTDGSVRVFFPQKKAFAKLNPGSLLAITVENNKEDINLLAGVSRWIVEKAVKSQKEVSLEFRTATAIMGVRGTDFFVSYNPLLAESEIICFDGVVNFKSAANPRDNKNITRGQWGGIGGRFGEQIGRILDLPAHVLEAFKNQISIDTTIPEATTPEATTPAP